MRMRSGFLLTGRTKPHLFTSISFHKKALSTLNIHVYKIFVRLINSQVLRKEDSSPVADRQTDRQTCETVFLLKLKALGTLDRHSHHLS